MRYFKFVGSEEEGRAYPVRIEPNEILSEDFRMYVNLLDTYFTVGQYADNSDSVWSHEWQEVLPQKTFPPDAVTLDTYETGKWYDVREVLPDESFHGRVVDVRYFGKPEKIYTRRLWDAHILQGFRSLGLEPQENIAYWRAGRVTYES